jgi:hypothetical protein
MRRGALIRLVEPRERIMGRTLGFARRASAGGGDMPVQSGERAATATIWATFALDQATP